MKAKLVVLVLAVVLPLSASSALADITVKSEASGGSIEVAVNNGSKSRIQHGEKCIFNLSSYEATVTAFQSGQEKACGKFRNGAKLVVTNSGGNWSISEDK